MSLSKSIRATAIAAKQGSTTHITTKTFHRYHQEPTMPTLTIGPSSAPTPTTATIPGSDPFSFDPILDAPTINSTSSILGLGLYEAGPPIEYKKLPVPTAADRARAKAKAQARQMCRRERHIERIDTVVAAARTLWKGREAEVVGRDVTEKEKEDGDGEVEGEALTPAEVDAALRKACEEKEAKELAFVRIGTPMWW